MQRKEFILKYRLCPNAYNRKKIPFSPLFHHLRCKKLRATELILYWSRSLHISSSPWAELRHWIQSVLECVSESWLGTWSDIELHKFRGAFLQPRLKNLSIMNWCLGENKPAWSTQNPLEGRCERRLQVTCTCVGSSLYCTSFSMSGCLKAFNSQKRL